MLRLGLTSTKPFLSLFRKVTQNRYLFNLIPFEINSFIKRAAVRFPLF